MFTLEKEALVRGLRSFRSPHVARILDATRDGGFRFLVMDEVDGTDLDTLLSALRKRTAADERPSLDVVRQTMTDALGAPVPSRPFDEARTYERFVARRLADVLRALGQVHEAGVIHRDLKLGNVLIDEASQLVIVDFGIAAMHGAHEEPGRLSGTLHNLAPEQIRNRETGRDPRTDVYQIGLILYALLALREAYDASDGDLVLGNILFRRHVPLGEAAPWVPEALVEICEKSFAETPEERYASALEFSEALEQWLDRTDLPRWDDQRYIDSQTLLQDARLTRLRAFDQHAGHEVFVEITGPALRQRARDEFTLIQRELTAIRQVDHPRVLSYRDALFDSEGAARTILRAREGRWLDDLLQERTALEPKELDRIGRDLAEGLGALHRAGHIHRGIEAAHVLIEPDGHAAIAGFCFVKPLATGKTSLVFDGKDRREKEAALPRYIAPEQYNGRAADLRVDVFGLGCLLYRIATGQEADEAEDGSFRQVEPKPLERAVGRPCAAVILKSLASVERSRYPTMDRFLEAWDAAPPGRRSFFDRTIRRRRR